MDKPFPKDIEEIMLDTRINTIMAAKTRVTTNWMSLMHSAKVNAKES